MKFTLSEGLHKLSQNCFITDSPYGIKNLMMNKPKFYRVLYDKNIDMYMIGDGEEVIHWEMLQKAYRDGYYYGIEDFIDDVGGTLDNYVEIGINGVYEDDYEVDPYLIYIWYSPQRMTISHSEMMGTSIDMNFRLALYLQETVT